jgi:hypothetical protein
MKMKKIKPEFNAGEIWMPPFGGWFRVVFENASSVELESLDRAQSFRKPLRIPNGWIKITSFHS